MNVSRNIREAKVSEAQKEILIQFMEDHEDFARGKMSGGLVGRKTWLAMWEMLANMLNNAGDSKKSTVKWQRAWSDLKQKTRRKASEIAGLKLRGTLPPNLKLSEFEEKLLAFMNSETLCKIQVPDKMITESHIEHSYYLPDHFILNGTRCRVSESAFSQPQEDINTQQLNDESLAIKQDTKSKSKIRGGPPSSWKLTISELKEKLPELGSVEDSMYILPVADEVVVESHLEDPSDPQDPLILDETQCQLPTSASPQPQKEVNMHQLNADVQSLKRSMKVLVEQHTLTNNLLRDLIEIIKNK